MKKVEMFLEQSSRHMAKALSRSRVVITCQDLELRYLWVFNPNDGLDKAVGKKLDEFGSQEQIDTVTPLKERVLETRKPYQETVSMMMDGERRTFDMTVTPTFDGTEMIGLTTISVELTDLLSAQEELHQAHSRLLGMLGDRMIGGNIRSGD